MAKTLSLFFRKKRIGVNSIESVFNAIEEHLYPHENVILPYEGGGPLTLLKNILFARRHSNTINHITGDIQYIAIATGRQSLLTIHDVGSALPKNILKKLYILLFWFWIPTLIVKQISVISMETKNDLIRICPWTKNKIFIIPNPINNKFVQKDNCELSDNTHHKDEQITTILHIGTKANKNLERVIDALANIQCRLIIIGKLTNLQKQKLSNNSITYTNKYDISFEELKKEYLNCDIVSFPSYFEGFGMPIIEAQATDKPILAGNISVLRNVAGENGALFVDPFDTNAIRKGFLSLINDKRLCNQLVQNGKINITRFDASQIATQYNHLYAFL